MKPLRMLKIGIVRQQPTRDITGLVQIRVIAAGSAEHKEFLNF